MTSIASVAVPSAVPELADLLEQHAAYEQGALGGPVHEVLQRLDGACAAGRVEIFLAHAPGGADGSDEVVGYASLTSDVATWTGREFGYLDCLFVRDGHRGQRIGAELVAALVARCRERGWTELQWQTPEWNEGAIRFYRRLGARDLVKARFTLSL